MEELKLADIERLARLVGKDGLASLEIRCGDTKLSLHAHTEQPAPAPSGGMPVAVAVSASESAPAPVPPLEEPGTLVTAPLVGTYYNAPAPDSPPFVTVGQKVKKGDILMVIESMKLMNEVPCETDGVVAEIYVQNATPVEFGQKLLRIC